jgi:hypothetical protein
MVPIGKAKEQWDEIIYNCSYSSQNMFLPCTCTGQFVINGYGGFLFSKLQTGLYVHKFSGPVLNLEFHKANLGIFYRFSPDTPIFSLYASHKAPIWHLYGTYILSVRDEKYIQFSWTVHAHHQFHGNICRSAGTRDQDDIAGAPKSFQAQLTLMMHPAFH